MKFSQSLSRGEKRRGRALKGLRTIVTIISWLLRIVSIRNNKKLNAHVQETSSSSRGRRSGWLRWEKKWTKCWQRRRRRWARRFNRLLETTGSRGLSGQRLDLKQAKIILMMSSSAQRNEVDQRRRRRRRRRMKGHNWSAAATKEEKRNHFLTITGCAARPASAHPPNQSVQFGSALSSLSCSSL